jgi:hypothetical protein
MVIVVTSLSSSLSPLSYYAAPPWVQVMLENDQPEYYKFPPNTDSAKENNAPIEEMLGPYEHPYWNLLLRAVVRGELYAAWTLLSHHSAVGKEGGLHDISPDAEGFAALRAILLSALIPGGRREENDDNYSR